MPEFALTILYMALGILLLAIAVYILLEVLAAIGVPISERIRRLLWLAVAIIVVIWIVRYLLVSGSVSMP